MKGGEKAGGFGRVVESWWRAPVLHLAVFLAWPAGGCWLSYWLDSLGQKHHLDFLAFLANLVALAWYLAWVGTLVAMPVAVVLQMARRQWKMAGKTALLAVGVAAIEAGILAAGTMVGR